MAKAGRKSQLRLVLETILNEISFKDLTREEALALLLEIVADNATAEIEQKHKLEIKKIKRNFLKQIDKIREELHERD